MKSAERKLKSARECFMKNKAASSLTLEYKDDKYCVKQFIHKIYNFVRTFLIACMKRTF